MRWPGTRSDTAPGATMYTPQNSLLQDLRRRDTQKTTAARPCDPNAGQTRTSSGNQGWSQKRPASPHMNRAALTAVLRGRLPPVRSPLLEHTQFPAQSPLIDASINAELKVVRRRQALETSVANGRQNSQDRRTGSLRFQRTGSVTPCRIHASSSGTPPPQTSPATRSGCQ
jgi:hypothetical protein